MLEVEAEKGSCTTFLKKAKAVSRSWKWKLEAEAGSGRWKRKLETVAGSGSRKWKQNLEAEATALF